MDRVERLRTEIRVQAWLRTWSAHGFMATVARKGDGDAGAVFLKINRFAAGCEVFSGVTGADGSPAWLRAQGKIVSERDADLYLTRQAGYDPDLWVLEVEDPKSHFRPDGKILDV